MDELQGHDRLLDEFLRTFDFLQIALKYGYMIQRLVRSIRPKIACAEADIVSWLYLSRHVVSGCVGKRGWCRDVHDSARLSANVSGYPNVTGHKLVLDAHCLADCKGLWSKRKSAGSQRTRQWELSIDQRLEFLPCCDSLLYKQCRYRGQVALEIGCADVMSRRHALYGMAKLIYVADVGLNGECLQRSNERPPTLIVGADGYFTRPKPCLPPRSCMPSRSQPFTCSRRVTPIIESCVTIVANFCTGQPIVAGGCIGKTM